MEDDDLDLEDFGIYLPEIPEIEILSRVPVILNSNPHGVPKGYVNEGRCIVYLWKISEFMVFKAGISSPNKGFDRLHEVINNLGHDAEILRVIRAKNADDGQVCSA